MNECICSGCKNLKNSINGDGGIEDFDCKFGFPSTDCENCDETECNVTCEHFESDIGEDLEVTVTCSKCGKELKKLISDNEEGVIICINCFLEG